MSSGVSIPQLMRVHFANVGHPDARLSPLTLNFFREKDDGDKEALDSVIWAENGVGKSSIRSLLFSLLHPNIHDVMRSGSGALDNRRFELFFGARDTAFVLTEWVLPASHQPVLTGFPEEPRTMVLGYLAHWPGSVQTTLSDLERHYFMFKPAGPITFDRLPVRGLAQGGEPVAGAREFLDWFREHAKLVEGRQTTTHKEWLDWLMEIGLDPMIFSYQLRMNSGPGGILGLFKNRLNSPTDFVHFFLDTVLSADAAADVIKVLNEKRRHIEMQPQWHAECTFVEEALPLLHELEREQAAYLAAEQARGEDRVRTGELIAALEHSEKLIENRISDLDADLRESEAAVKVARQESVAIQDLRIWLRHHEHQLELAKSEQELDNARANYQAQLKELRLLRAALEYKEWRAVLDECAAIESELKRRRDKNLDVEKELRQAGTALIQVLNQEIRRADAEHEEARKALAAARKNLQVNQKKFHSGKSDLGTVRETIRGTIEAMMKREKAQRRMLLSGTMLADEGIEAAQTRWRGVSRDAQARLDSLGVRSTELEKEMTAVREARHQRVVAITRLFAEIEQLERRQREDASRQQALEWDTELRLLFGDEQVDLADPDLLDRVHQQVNHYQDEIFRLSRQLADEKETLAAIEQSDSQLYPPPPEVAKVLRALREDLRIPAFLGTEELDRRFPDNPEEAEKLFVADPTRYLGIMVHTREALEKVRDQQHMIQKPAFPVQISFSEGPSTALPADVLVLAPGHRAAFNRRAAETMVGPLSRGLAAREQRIGDLTQAHKKLRRTVEELESFLTKYPAGSLRELNEMVENQSAAMANLERDQEADEQRLRALDAERASVNTEAAEAANQSQHAAGALHRLRDFAEDHEQHFKKLQAELSRERERLHLLEDENSRLEALIEEELAAVAQRQESVFHAKATVDQFLEKQRGITYHGGQLANVKGMTLTAAEHTYRLCHDRFRQVSEKDETLRARLEEKHAGAARQEERFRKELGEHPESDLLNLLAEGKSEDRLRLAESREQAAAKAVGAAEAAIETARAQIRELQPLAADYQAPKGERPPKTIAEAKRRRQHLNDEMARLAKRIDELKDRQNDLMNLVRQLTEDLNLRKFKRRELATHIPEFVAAAQAPRMATSNQEIEETLRVFWEEFRAHQKAYSSARLNLDSRCNQLRDLAGDARFQNFPNDKRELLKEREPLLRLTADIIKEFNIFRNVIQTSLRMSEESVDAIVTRLDAGVTDAMYLLNLAKSSSRLPESMEGWSGRSFLKIECRSVVGDRLEDRRAVYQRVIREALRSGKPMQGVDLIKRGVDALVGEKGYRVSVMKPGYGLKTNYHPVIDVKGWSDGEKITTVILLYCTMVQLRALSTGEHGRATHLRKSSNGMLFLDNPFGEANSMTFVKMQLLMARALDIQLVYTASGSHKHLLARFPRVIRLSQEQGTSTEKTFVRATEVGPELRAGETAVSAAHFGRRAS